MIDVQHTGGCGDLAFALSGIPVGREIIYHDVIYPGRGPAWTFGPDAVCVSCGEVVDLDAVRAELGSIPNGAESEPDTAAVRQLEPADMQAILADEPPAPEAAPVKTLEQLMDERDK